MSNSPLFLIAGLKTATRQFVPVLKLSWPGLLILWIVSQSFTEFFVYTLQQVGPFTTLGIYANLGLMLLSLVVAMILILLIPLRIEDLDAGRRPTPFWAFTHEHTGPLVLESLRALAQILLWSLLFIIPGLVKQIRYLMVPYIVLFDPRYPKGEVDALEESNQIVKGSTLQLFLMLLVIFVFDFSFDLLNHKYNFFTAPAYMVALSLLNILLSVYTYTLIYAIYKEKTKWRADQ